MTKINFPQTEKEQKRAERKSEKATRKQEKAEDRAYLRPLCTGMPLLSMEYLPNAWSSDSLSGFLVKGLALMGLGTGIFIYYANGLEFDFTCLHPGKNILVLPIGLNVIYALGLAGLMLYNRKKVIYERGLDFGFNDDVCDSNFNVAFEKYSNEYDLNRGSFYCISRPLLKNRSMNSPIYFAKILNYAYTNDKIIQENPTFVRTIIEGHLTNHPEDIQRVLDVFNAETLPKSIRKYIPKTH